MLKGEKNAEKNVWNVFKERKNSLSSREKKDSLSLKKEVFIFSSSFLSKFSFFNTKQRFCSTFHFLIANFIPKVFLLTNLEKSFLTLHRYKKCFPSFFMVFAFIPWRSLIFMWFYMIFWYSRFLGSCKWNVEGKCMCGCIVRLWKWWEWKGWMLNCQIKEIDINLRLNFIKKVFNRVQNFKHFTNFRVLETRALVLF